MLHPIFVIFYLCFIKVLSYDYDQIDEPLFAPDPFAEEVKQDNYDTYSKIVPRSNENSNCIQQLLSSLRESAQKFQQDLSDLEQYIMTSEADSTTETPETNGNCETETPRPVDTPLNVSIDVVESNASGTGNISECETPDNSQNNPKMKSWDKQISVCKEILQNNKNLIEAISNIDHGKRRTIKIRSKKRKLLGKNRDIKRNNVIWTEWTSWSPCSVSCGNGKQIRYRKCVGGNCQADIEMDERQCAQPNCDTDLYKVLKMF